MRAWVSECVKSPRTTSTPSRGERVTWSTAMTPPFGPTHSPATWDHPPGAAPRSTTTSPSRNKLYRRPIGQLDRGATPIRLPLRGSIEPVVTAGLHPRLAHRRAPRPRRSITLFGRRLNMLTVEARQRPYGGHADSKLLREYGHDPSELPRRRIGTTFDAKAPGSEFRQSVRTGRSVAPHHRTGRQI